MKIRYFSFALLLSFFFTINMHAQVTNLQVNGVSSNFTVASGGVLTWNYNVPVGATAVNEIWYDVNQNGSIDAGDILYASFSVTDGVANGDNGPGDGDGLANGLIILSPTVLGFAPGQYILKFTENNQGITIVGTVTPLLYPAHSLSGTVTPPTGKSAANIIVEVSRSNKYSPNFWDGITDANGNYTIHMNSDTAGNPWQVYVSSNPFPGYILNPNELNITIDGNPLGLNFMYTAPVAKVGGLLEDDNGNILKNQSVDLMKIDNNNNTQMHSEASTDVNGLFFFGLGNNNLDVNMHWRVWAGSNNDSGVTTNLMAAVWNINTLNSGDSLFSIMTAYITNTTISGVVKFNGNILTSPITIVAADLSDVAESSVWSQSGTGTFSVPVSNKFFSYKIGGGNSYMGGYVYAAPGATGVELNLGGEGVKSENNGIPTTYSLNQNYPNPFNPSTTISFGIPERVNVNLTVFNQLGQQVCVLVNEEMNPGMHSVNFKGVNLSSGIYFYKLSAGNFQSVKKLMLLK